VPNDFLELEMRYRACTLFVLVIAVLACNIPSPRTEETPTATATVTATEGSVLTEAPTSTDTLTPEPRATDTPEAQAGTAAPPASTTPEPPKHGALVYETQFMQGWPPLTGDKANGKMVTGGYQIDITLPWALYAFTTRARQSTFFGEITASASQCPSGHGGYGMIFHYQSETSFRFAVIWCSGRYSLQERTGPTSASTLSEGNLPEGITPSSGEHRIAVRSHGNKLTLYVDDAQITQADVTTMPTGDVGPYAETTGEPITVLFKRLAVYASE
jgi:hypothetical protein